MPKVRVWLSEKYAPYTLFAVALIAHLALFYALLYLYGPCSFFLSNDCALNGNDTQHYVILAYNLSHGNGYSRFIDAPYESDALRTPLLPLYFVPFAYFGGYSLIWLAILLLNIGLPLAAPLAYKLARYFLPHRYALLAGLTMALEPLYLYRSQIAEPDALLVLLVLISLFFVVRSWFRGFAPDIYRAAFFLGLAILAKPSALYLAIIIFLFELVHLVFFAKGASVEKGKQFALALCILCAIIAPWVMRNTSDFGVAAVSSIQGYNLYEYYTKDLVLPEEKIPADIAQGSREPSRFLPYQSFFTETAIARIRAHPALYVKEQLVGTIRNAFVSDISQIHYYGHDRLLPFAYNPESRINLHELLLSGSFSGFLRALFSVHVLPKLLWIALLGLVYACACAGLVAAWLDDRKKFLSYLLFGALYGYLLVASGPFVDAKYRLPALLLVVVVALYGVHAIATKRFLRARRK